MTRIKNTLEMRGIQREEFIKYFQDIGGEYKGDGIIKGDFWEVQIGPQTPSYLGKLVIASIIITLSVEEEFYEKFLHKFRLNFMRGGA